ncbi:MAG: hypothetical protein SGJ18_07430 [Pseudomonadota bacterium]|nr:hypothetical protein [Pseudomonadota bacterium]
MKISIISLASFLAFTLHSFNSFACDAFKPKGEMIRSFATSWFTDTDGKEQNLAVIFRSYDEDGDKMADMETATRLFKDRGEEAFPFLYLRGKDVPYSTRGNETTYTLDPEIEYSDIGATGKCDDIILSPNSRSKPI